MAGRTAETIVAIGIVQHGDCILVGRRSEDVALPGYDEFPGGKCQSGETPEACVKRECLEETGFEVVVSRLRREVVHTYEHGALRLFFFDCELAGSSDPQPPFRWVSREELKCLRFPKANRAVVEELVSE